MAAADSLKIGISLLLTQEENIQRCRCHGAVYFFAIGLGYNAHCGKDSACEEDYFTRSSYPYEEGNNTSK